LGLKQITADWARYGRGAKVIRANQLIESAGQAVFFWDGVSKTVAVLVEKAKDKGIPVEVMRFGSCKQA